MWFAKRGADLRNAKGLRVHRMEQSSATRHDVDHSQSTRLPCASRAAQVRHCDLAGEGRSRRGRCRAQSLARATSMLKLRVRPGLLIRRISAGSSVSGENGSDVGMPWATLVSLVGCSWPLAGLEIFRGWPDSVTVLSACQFASAIILIKAAPPTSSAFWHADDQCFTLDAQPGTTFKVVNR